MVRSVTEFIGWTTRRRRQLTRHRTICMTLCMAKLVSVRVEEDLLDEIDRAGGAEGRGRSEVVEKRWSCGSSVTRRGEGARSLKGYAERPVKADEFEPVLSAQRWPK